MSGREQVALLYPDQCCSGYCVEDLLHDLRLDQAERFIEVLAEERAQAWDEGALWAAVECGAIADESVPWLAPGDNPYRSSPTDSP